MSSHCYHFVIIISLSCHHINDLEKNIKFNVKFFADDTMLYSVVKDSASELNHDLVIIQQWAYQWKMVFNPDPTKQANEVFHVRKLPPNHRQLLFNQVTQMNEHKHSGLIYPLRIT